MRERRDERAAVDDRNHSAFCLDALEEVCNGTASSSSTPAGQHRAAGQHLHRAVWRSIKMTKEVHSQGLRRWPRSAKSGIGQCMEFSSLAVSPAREQPNDNKRVARRLAKCASGPTGSCGYDASLGQRKRVAHIPTAATENKRRKRLEYSFEEEENRKRRRLYSLEFRRPAYELPTSEVQSRRRLRGCPLTRLMSSRSQRQ